MVTVIDGKGLIYGRLASDVACRILNGEEVVVLNAEQIIVSGERSEVFADFKHKVDVGEVTKRKGPFYPRRADLLFKRCWEKVYYFYALAAFIVGGVTFAVCLMAVFAQNAVIAVCMGICTGIG